MLKIECINFISSSHPNVLLIASMRNEVASGYHLKHFSNTHNIYTLMTITDDNFSYYYDLKEKYNDIKAELDKNNLYNFIINTRSFGSLIGFFIIFHFPNRVNKAIIHDYSFRSNWPITSDKFNLNKWNIHQVKTLPIVFYLYQGFSVNKQMVKELIKLFPNIFFILVPKEHTWFYYLNTKFEAFIFYCFNCFSLNCFHNQILPKFYNNSYNFKKFKKISLYFFLKFFKYEVDSKY